jgi:hypothetical protein
MHLWPDAARMPCRCGLSHLCRIFVLLSPGLASAQALDVSPPVGDAPGTTPVAPAPPQRRHGRMNRRTWFEAPRRRRTVDTDSCNGDPVVEHLRHTGGSILRNPDDGGADFGRQPCALRRRR